MNSDSNLNPQPHSDAPKSGTGDSKGIPSTETLTHPKDSKSAAVGGSQQADYAPYPKLEPDDVAPVVDTWSSNPAVGGTAATTTTTMPTDSNPYVSGQPVSPSKSIISFLFIKLLLSINSSHLISHEILFCGW